MPVAARPEARWRAAVVPGSGAGQGATQQVVIANARSIAWVVMMGLGVGGNRRFTSVGSKSGFAGYGLAPDDESIPENHRWVKAL